MFLFVPLSLLLFAFVTNGVTILVTGNIKDDLSEFRMNLCLGRLFIGISQVLLEDRLIIGISQMRHIVSFSWSFRLLFKFMIFLGLMLLLKGTISYLLPRFINCSQ